MFVCMYIVCVFVCVLNWFRNRSVRLKNPRENVPARRRRPSLSERGLPVGAARPSYHSGGAASSNKASAGGGVILAAYCEIFVFYEFFIVL